MKKYDVLTKEGTRALANVSLKEAKQYVDYCSTLYCNRQPSDYTIEPHAKLHQDDVAHFFATHKTTWTKKDLIALVGLLDDNDTLHLGSGEDIYIDLNGKEVY